MDYEDIVRGIKEAGDTQVPGLMITAMKEAKARGVFTEGAMIRIAQRIETGELAEGSPFICGYKGPK